MSIITQGHITCILFITSNLQPSVYVYCGYILCTLPEHSVVESVLFVEHVEWNLDLVDDLCLQELPHGLRGKSEVAKDPENKLKNRYGNIIACE